MVNKMKRYLLALCALLLIISTLGIGAFATEITTANIPVAFLQDGNVPDEPEQCIVEIIPADPSFPMPAESEEGVYRMEITSGASDTIDIPCDRVGVFSYTVQQVPGENEHCIYDDSTYSVTVFVTYSETDEVEVNIVAYKDDAEEKIDIEFFNYYSIPDQVTISAIKTLDYTTPDDNMFSFQLIGKDGTVIETVKNKGKEVTFQPLVFNDLGTFTYTIKEVDGKDNIYTYDTTVYEATIEVVRDEENDYKATLTYKKDGSDYTGTPTFANTTIPVVPSTGDMANILLYAVLLVISAAAILLILVMKQRKTTN